MTVSLPVLPGFTFRFARYEDLPAIHQMLVRAAEADRSGHVDSLEDLTNEFIDAWSDPEKDFLLALAVDGQVAAMGRVYVNPDPQRERHANLWGGVHPEQRGRGLREAILTWMEARARQRLLEFPADLPRTLRTGCYDYLTDRIALFEQHGFNPLRYWNSMRRDLSQPIPDEYLPSSLALCTYRSELDQALWGAFNESFNDHWGFEPIPYGEWQKYLIQAASFRPELTFLALDSEGGSEQIAGFSVNFVREEDNQRQGIAEGHIGELGTRRAWRKRGIASALVCASMRAFKAAGLEFAGLSVDADSPTGASGLYERLGFKVIKRSITFSKPVEQGEDLSTPAQS
jgi:mycothiol synthase